jgi:hypothetical protein
LDRDIESFRRLQTVANDPMALVFVEEAITDLEAEKASLHSKEK